MVQQVGNSVRAVNDEFKAALLASVTQMSKQVGDNIIATNNELKTALLNAAKQTGDSVKAAHDSVKTTSEGVKAASDGVKAIGERRKLLERRADAPRLATDVVEIQGDMQIERSALLLGKTDGWKEVVGLATIDAVARTRERRHAGKTMVGET